VHEGKLHCFFFLTTSTGVGVSIVIGMGVEDAVVVVVCSILNIEREFFERDVEFLSHPNLSAKIEGAQISKKFFQSLLLEMQLCKAGVHRCHLLSYIKLDF
jgi:hypothetical protein